jgi:hypothetical protein
MRDALYYEDPALAGRVPGSIFLVGPSTSCVERTPWRIEAMTIARALGYRGMFVVPEFSRGGFRRGPFDEDGGLELKAPNTSTHINTLLSESFDEKYYLQCQWCMACTKRAWWDLCTFDPRMPEHMRYWCKRVHRDDALIAELEREVATFLGEVAAKIAALQEKYPERLAA